MDARYLKAANVLPRQNKVCGRTLRPFCLRHRVMLQVIDSPFVKDGQRTFKGDDVIRAVKIMSTYDKEEAMEPLSWRDNLELVLMRNSRKRLLRNIGMVIGIMATSCSYPKFWDKSSSNKSNKSYESIPWELACVANLARNGVSLEEAWTMPEGEAVWMSLASAIYNGAKVDVLSTEEEKDLENFNERIESYKKANKHN